ncbi:MAG: helix-turn-helix domain-containing protein [Euryarchaeota archaeon]|nr:helix-turn-helix domain-containing protein [Euryarchaeota archaeon]
MAELDKLLSVIENPTRRRILEALVREPHYPLQLSKELGISQQAVMKHLKVLEAYGLVRSYREESDLGGPMRKKFYPALNFTIVVDVSPNLFSAELISRRDNVLPEYGRGAERDDDFEENVKALRQKSASIDAQLEELRHQREKLIREKESIMDEANRLMTCMEDYQLRRIMYEFISHPEMELSDIARALSIRDEVVIHALKEWLRSKG